ncbi:MAG TPA: TonB-dependent receptor [Terriglobia bacterium]|nr:TonB-dependent receptor [Terriglobia bacterium]
MRWGFSFRDWFLALSCAAALTLVAPGGVRAQLLQGTIDGNVADSTQAAIAEAIVTAKDQQTNFTRETKTSSVGGYSLPGLPPGTYLITVSSAGFQSYTQTGITVTPNRIRRVDVTLAVGQVTESVTVEASAAALQTDRSEIRSDIAGITLTNVPVPIGRNYQLLMPTIPGVSEAQNGNSFAANPTRSVNFSVNGTPTNINNFSIDGTNSRGVIDSTFTYIPALEAVQEVSVITNSFDAEQGLAGGAAIALQIKSGSNVVHGSLFGFHTDQHMKAYQWAADRTQPKPKYIYNQYGATIGGPIKKDRLFYFGSYEGTNYSESVTQIVQVPTLAMRAGDLSASPTPIYDPQTGNPDGTGRTPFPGNIIPRNRIDPGIQTILNLGGWAPNTQGSGAFGLARNYVTSAPNYQWRRQYDSKLSYNPTSKLSVFGRFGFVDHNANTDGIFGSLGGLPISRANTGSGFVEGHLYQWTVSATYVATPNMVIDGNYGYFREDFHDIPPRGDENLGWTVMKVPGLQTDRKTELGWPLILIDGFSQLGAANNFEPHGYRDPTYDYAANLSWNRGTHNVRFGFGLNRQHINESQPQGNLAYIASQGGFQFSPGATQLNGGPAGNDFNTFAAFLLGLPSNAGKLRLFPVDIQTRMKAYSMYARDRWQITRKLTFSYGVRVELFPFPTRVGRGLEVYDFDKNVMLLCGLGPNPIDCGITKGKGGPTPRAGLAYRISDSMVLRAGYGITWDPINLSSFQRLNYPDLVQVSLNRPNGFSWATTLRQGFPEIVQPDLKPGILPVASNLSIITIDNNNLVRGYIQSWNLTGETRIGDWVGSAGYVATRTTDQLHQLDANWSPIGTGTAGQVLNRRFGRTAATRFLGTLGTTKYDSLQTRLEHRFSGGYQVSFGYTWAHGRGYSAETSGAVPGPSTTVTVGHPSYYQLNYGDLTRDIRHNFQATGIVELPFGKGKPWAQGGPFAQIVGGWQINALFSAYTGSPFTVIADSSTLNSSASTQRADCVSGTQHKRGDIYQWYDRSDFRVPASGRFGTCGANTLRGPGLVNLDMGVDRKWRFGEQSELKFRVESFNVANTPHHSNPTNNVNSGGFMEALGIRNTGRDGLDERNFRVGLKFSW